MTENSEELLISAITLVVLSGFIHSIWNLFTKRSVNKVVFLWFCQWIAVLVFLPLTVIDIIQTDIRILSLSAWVFILASMIFHGSYVLLLAYAYTISDLSQAYPIMRGISPLLIPIIGVFLLNEYLPWSGWLGVVLIVSGIFLINGFQKGKLLTLNKATLVACSVGLMITSYTIVDTLTLDYISPIILNEVSNFGNLLALSYIALRSGAIQTEWKINWRFILLGGILAPGGYILFLMALDIMPVSKLAPIREIGTVFGTIFGVFLLKEKQGRSRILASIIITAGIIVLAWGSGH
jgi:drug/metabolite transporter (DMT)-like permease